MSSHVFRDMNFKEGERYRAPIKHNYLTGGIQGPRSVYSVIRNLLDEGIHLTANAYVATHLLKDLTATEYEGEINLGN